MSAAPADVKVMMLFCAPEKQEYFGLIPDDQDGFIDKLKEVVTKQKQIWTAQQQRVSGWIDT